MKNVSFSFFIFNGNRKPKQRLSLLFFSPTQNSNVFIYFPSSFSMLFCRHTVTEVNERSHGQWLYYGLCVNVFFFLYILMLHFFFVWKEYILKMEKTFLWNWDDLAEKAQTMVVGAPENFGFQSFTYTSWYWETFNLSCQHREIATRTAL